MPRLRPWRASDKGKEGCSPGRLLRSAIANNRQCAIGADNGLGGPAAIDETAENEMKIRIAGALSKDNEVDLLRVELERRVGPGDDLLAVLLFCVRADGEDAHVGEDLLRRHDFDPSSLGGFLVAREADDVDAVIGENESASRRIAVVVGLDRDRALSARQDRGYESAPPPAVTSLSCRIGSPRRKAVRVIEPSASLSASGFADFVIINSETAAFGHVCHAVAPSLTTAPIGRS
jgi:hypothetical protein